MDKKLITIIIPCYNEQDNIKKLEKELNEFTCNSHYNWEFLLVNDGSNDDTYNEIKKICKKSNYKLINFSRNFGKESAILAGLDFAKGDATIIIDADLQMPLKYINTMLDYWQDGYKLVLSHKSNRKKSFTNFLASKYYKVYNKITNNRIKQDALDFQLMDRIVVNYIISYREKNRFFKGITGTIGFESINIPVEIDMRTTGESKFNNLIDLFKYALSSIIIDTTVPLKLGLYIGIVIVIIGIILAITTIIQTIIHHSFGSGYTTLLSIIIFFFGFLTILIGIIGVYIGMIYEEVRKRPNYIIDEKINMD